MNRTVHWAGPAGTLVTFLVLAGWLVAPGTLPGGPRIVGTSGEAFFIRIGRTAANPDGR